MASSRSYFITEDNDHPDRVVITDADWREIRIHREDADPEHRFTAQRLAAAWFGNAPAQSTPTEGAS